MTSRRKLRQAMRARRRSVDDRQRAHAALALFRRLSRSGFFMAARHVAVYLPTDGEIDLQPAVAHLWKAGRRVYLPVVRRDKKLDFAAFEPDTPLRPNRFGIPEPVPHRGQRVQPRQLDLVLMPLVAFDTDGNRLGMGGGYYDRTFAFLRDRSQWRKPFLAGVAFDFQKTAAVTAQPWDIPLRKIVTDNAVYG